MVDLEIEACLGCQPQQLVHAESGALHEDWVQDHVNQPRMPLPLMLTQQNVVLDMEVTLVIVEIDVTTHHEHSHHIVLYLSNKALVLTLRVDYGVMHSGVDLFLVVKVAGESALDVLDVNLLSPSHKHVNVQESVSM